MERPRCGGAQAAGSPPGSRAPLATRGANFGGRRRAAAARGRLVVAYRSTRSARRPALRQCTKKRRRHARPTLRALPSSTMKGDWACRWASSSGARAARAANIAALDGDGEAQDLPLAEELALRVVRRVHQPLLHSRATTGGARSAARAPRCRRGTRTRASGASCPSSSSTSSSCRRHRPTRRRRRASCRRAPPSSPSSTSAPAPRCSRACAWRCTPRSALPPTALRPRRRRRDDRRAPPRRRRAACARAHRGRRRTDAAAARRGATRRMLAAGAAAAAIAAAIETVRPMDDTAAAQTAARRGGAAASAARCAQFSTTSRSTAAPRRRACSSFSAGRPIMATARSRRRRRRRRPAAAAHTAAQRHD